MINDIAIFFIFQLVLLNTVFATTDSKKILILGSNYILNVNAATKENLVDKLQDEYNSYANFPEARFINGGPNDDLNITKSTIFNIQPEYTILITGLPFEIINNYMSNLSFFNKLCPYEKIKSVNEKNASIFLENYINSIKQIQLATKNINGKFIVLFLGANITRQTLINKLNICQFLSYQIGELGISSDTIINELIKNKIQLLHSTFFSKIINYRAINKEEKFLVASDKQLVSQISFWLFPELIK